MCLNRENIDIFQQQFVNQNQTWKIDSIHSLNNTRNLPMKTWEHLLLKNVYDQMSLYS